MITEIIKRESRNQDERIKHFIRQEFKSMRATNLFNGNDFPGFIGLKKAIPAITFPISDLDTFERFDVMLKTDATQEIALVNNFLYDFTNCILFH